MKRSRAKTIYAFCTLFLGYTFLCLTPLRSEEREHKKCSLSEIFDFNVILSKKDTKHTYWWLIFKCADLPMKVVKGFHDTVEVFQIVDFYQGEIRVLLTTVGGMGSVWRSEETHGDLFDIVVPHSYKQYDNYKYEFDGNVYKPKAKNDPYFIPNCDSLVAAVNISEVINNELNGRKSLIEAHRSAIKLYREVEKDSAATLLLNEMTRYIAISKVFVIGGIYDDRLSTKVDISIVNDLGFFLEQAGQFENARKILDGVISHHPDRIPAYLNIADAYMGLGKHSAARDYYKEYYERMVKAGKKQKIPTRVIQMLK